MKRAKCIEILDAIDYLFRSGRITEPKRNSTVNALKKAMKGGADDDFLLEIQDMEEENRQVLQTVLN